MCPFGLWLLTPTLLLMFFARRQAGGCPAATHFFLLRQKKVSKEKATPLSASLRFAAGNLRCSGQPGSGSNSASASDNRPPWSVWTSAPRRIQKGWGRIRERERNRAPARSRKERPRLSELVLVFPPQPVGLVRGAQAKADQGSRLSEAKPSSSETPLLASTAACPAA